MHRGWGSQAPPITSVDREQFPDRSGLVFLAMPHSPRLRGPRSIQLAQELFSSPRTINAHLGSVYHKIDTSTRALGKGVFSEAHIQHPV
jgi:hypothetical protein